MKRRELLAYLIISFLLVAASQLQFSIAIRIQAMEAAGKIRPANPQPNSGNRFLLSAWEPASAQFNDNMKKVPSAPNPIGNRHPPSKP